MTRDRIKEISEKAARRVADQKVGTRPIAAYANQVADLKKKKRLAEDAELVKSSRRRA